ncbi:hypothetical protein DFH94DRAFT_16874 [Russula ochroleuca]|jgi:hypothetical protein|uniref:Uncharacterized protein n=1 Tax=Russula ochroleuca TaxID=152965 RepID=A0A9P5N6H3_9AGAM|nr:hypothetical protein DFH94DRAFT_16874 [Russula ochroleuca]
MLRRVSSTISIPGVTLASRPPPTAASPLLFFSPPSPTSPTRAPSLPSGVDTDPNAIKFSELVQPGNMLFRPFKKSLSPVVPFFSGAGIHQVPPLELSLSSSLSSSCRWQKQQPVSLYEHSSSLRVRRVAASTISAGAACAGSGSTLDAATRLRDFRALIDEMRATLLHHDLKEEFDAGNQCDDDDGDDDERERLLRLLEDVMREVQRLAERDTTVLSL